MLSVQIQLRWGDIDQYKHVNNVRYAQFLEDTRVLFMHKKIQDLIPEHSLGEKNIWDLLGPEGAGYVARQEIEYREETKYSLEPIEVRTGVSQIGGSSYDLAFYVYHAGSLKVLAEATVVIVNRETGRPTRIPSELKEVLESLRCEPVPFRRRRQEQQRQYLRQSQDTREEE